MADNEKTVDKAVKTAKPEKPAKPKAPKVSIKERVSNFIREYRSELKKIVWFSREATLKSSVFVIISLLICAAVLGVTDFTLSKAILALGKLI
ncbi:MAG: preprotein translocase subunit SecE [Clostridiales bacterium]|jgi:preprotein translocase SecE subunit|nr:preprotein translocase subunit SecE [Clostridiales bacterium]